MFKCREGVIGGQRSQSDLNLKTAKRSLREPVVPPKYICFIFYNTYISNAPCHESSGFYFDFQ
jgi:hypothetical protein